MERKKILIVEDNPDDVELTLLAFKKNNITNEIVVVNDGEKALEYIFCTGRYVSRDPGDLPSVVLLDIKLPKVNGLEVLKKMRSEEQAKLIPVVILTSSKEEQDVINGYKFGCNSYVRKPVKFDEFVEAVRQLGLYWLLLNEAPPQIKELK
jgi:two-component system response regulator